ncbi:hypothetical protein FB451DRAFT_1185189 [Mycena latifolia]|nr:hypothetical protein FB451DRAFT_1185189 [Mycena latifolia]
MPQPTKAQAYSDLLFVAENLLAASIALAGDLDDLDAGDWADEDFDADCLPNDVSGVLDLTSLNWMEIAEYLMGGGSRGPYNKIPKSVDLFLAPPSTACEISTSLLLSSIWSNPPSKVAEDVLGQILEGVVDGGGRDALQAEIQIFVCFDQILNLFRTTDVNDGTIEQPFWCPQLMV